MYDTTKLRGRIIEKYGSQNAFAKAVNRSITNVSQYLNGHIYLDQRTIDEWANALDISIMDLPAYFFTKKVHEIEQSS